MSDPNDIDLDAARISPENQKFFAEMWGDDFESMQFKNYMWGVSPDGLHFALFVTPEGHDPVRVSFPVTESIRMLEFVTATINLARERMLVRYVEPPSEAKN